VDVYGNILIYPDNYKAPKKAGAARPKAAVAKARRAVKKAARKAK
jgi:hypothetical protein